MPRKSMSKTTVKEETVMTSEPNISSESTNTAKPKKVFEPP